MPREILESKPLTNYETLKILQEKMKDEIHRPLVARTIEYLSQIIKHEIKEPGKALEELLSLGISVEGAVVLLNIAPSDVTEARAILPPKDSKVSTEVIEKALDIIKSHSQE